MNITQRLLFFENGGLPTEGLLFYSRLPNTEDILWDEEALWDENMLWGGWVLPVECYPFMEHDDGFWFTDSTTSVARTGEEILAWPWINQGNIEFSLAAGLSVRWNRVAYYKRNSLTDADGNYDITAVSHPGDTVLTAGHTYSLHVGLRAALGSVDGVDHWAFSDAGVPKVVSYETMVTNGVGPRGYFGAKGAAVYEIDMDTAPNDKDAKIKKYLKVTA